MQYIQFQSQDPNSLNTPSVGNFNIFVDQTDNNLKVKNSDGEVYGGNGGGGYSEVTYSGLVNTIMASGLTAGSFYLITDFRTCYDQPDFDYNGDAITTGATKQAAVEPIVVFATSESTISSNTYQPLYPNDRIQYDWTFSATEVTNSTAFGRITERIDEFNNRTDYDHRTILFKRYRLYTHRQDQRLNGTIELFEDGSVEGNNTSFELLNVGDVIYVPSVSPSYYEITSIDDDTNMTVSGDTISTDGSGLSFYLAVEEITNDDDYGGYFSYKRTNVKTDDFIEYTTFGDAISENYAKNNYVGNYANNYTNISDGTFILANNVFILGEYESNKFGDYCYNNTWGTDNGNNTWGDYCYNNVSTNDIDDSIIGHYFHDNLINTNITDNHIGNDFNNNQLLAENGEDFEDNIIGNDFNNNIIYSRFYKNEILDNFNGNTIGDFGNLDNNEFYRNYIRNNFNSNIIRRDFQNNQIGTNFQENEINGEFIGNTILNGFNNNQTGQYFAVNNIGNGFNNNIVYDSFYNNSTDYYFYNNVISNNFYNNNIGTYFENNEPYNRNLFDWGNTNIENLTGRTYDTFYQSLNGDIDYRILGKQLIMHDTNNDEYYRVKFTQWTRSDNGGGFSYERTKIYPTEEDTVYFTKRNYENDVDVIVEGSLEITRDNDGGIYNQADEGSWNQNQSPVGTEWNSIYTQENNGERFVYNKIGDKFQNNTIGNNFGYDDDDEQDNGNEIGDNFEDNTIVSTMYGNVIGNNFNNNEIYSSFYDNEILIDFNDNTIGDSDNLDNNEFYRNYIRNNFNENNIRQDFQNNQIGTNFQENEINGEFLGNTILNGYNNNQIFGDFELNNIGNGFNNNIVYHEFRHNTTDYYFYNNIISYDFEYNNIGTYFENNKPSNYNLFGWEDLSTVSTRTYDTLRESLNNNVGSYILGIELVMKVISTSQYFKIKFTKWTQGGNGGGFQYDRQEIDSNGNNIGSEVTFTKTNYGSEVDVIVEGVVELTRDSQGGLYNTITDTPPFNNQWPGPGDTEWNSIYTQPNNGENFQYNKIGNNFYNNVIGNDFRDNQIGNDFRNNDIANDFRSNVIGMSFESNIILDGFGFGGSLYRGNKIGNYFYNNEISEYFYNNTISDNFTNNTIGDYFQWNIVNTNVEFQDFTSNYGNITGFTYTATGTSATDNIYTVAGTTNGNGVGATFNVEVSSGAVIGVTGITEGILYVTGDTITILGTDIGGYSNSIDTISDYPLGKNGSDGTYNDLSVTGGTGTNATFDVSVNSGLVDGVLINNRGNGYQINDELTIIGSLFGGTDGVDDITITVTAIFNDDVVITVTGISVNPSVYEQYTCQIFERRDGAKRLSFYDENDIMTITDIDE